MYDALWGGDVTGKLKMSCPMAMDMRGAVGTNAASRRSFQQFPNGQPQRFTLRGDVTIRYPERKW